MVKWLRDDKGKALVTESQVQVLTAGGQPTKKNMQVLVVSYDLVTANDNPPRKK